MLPCSTSTSDRTTSLSLLAPTPNWSAHRAGCGGWKGQRARCVEPPFQVHAASTYLPHLRRWPRHAMHGAETWTQLLPQSQQARKTVNERNTIGKTGHFLARARQPNLFLCCFNPFLYLSGCGCWRVPFCWFVSACLFYFREKKKSVLCHSFKRGELWEREKKKKRWKEREFRWLAFETCNRLGSAGAVESDGPKDGNECCGEGQRRDWCVTAVTAGLPSAFPCSFIIIIIPSPPHFLLSKIGQTLQ